MTSEVTEERTAEGARSFSSPTGVFGQFGGQVVTSVERGEGRFRSVSADDCAASRC
ncbi:MAG: hypothetical protein ACTS6G_06130 [Candidatus Hodgkinia cicadicola]